MIIEKKKLEKLNNLLVMFENKGVIQKILNVKMYPNTLHLCFNTYWNFKNSTFDWSKVFLNWSKYLINLFRSLWTTWSILDSCLIDQKEFSINRKIEEIHHEVFGWLDRFSIPVRLIKRNIRSINRNSRLIKTHKIEFFQIFLVTVFNISLEQNIVLWSHENEIEIKTKFHWCYCLKVQYGIVKIKLKQHHNTNISFIKQ